MTDAVCHTKGMTTSKKFSDLTRADAGRTARLTRADGEVVEGQLFEAANPSYKRVTHWYLSRPCPLPQFEREALSLQWEAGETEVELVD